MEGLWGKLPAAASGDELDGAAARRVLEGTEALIKQLTSAAAAWKNLSDGAGVGEGNNRNNTSGGDGEGNNASDVEGSDGEGSGEEGLDDEGYEGGERGSGRGVGGSGRGVEGSGRGVGGAQRGGGVGVSGEECEVGVLVAAAYPDWIAQRRDRGNR